MGIWNGLHVQGDLEDIGRMAGFVGCLDEHVFQPALGPF